jgi:hypothetical protein
MTGTLPDLPVRRTGLSNCPGDFAESMPTLFDPGGTGCTIRTAEERGITIVQLERLLAFVRIHCVRERWKGRRPTASGGWEEVALTPEMVTLYDINELVVLPATKERACAFVELLATAAQPPDWFVSHWWGGSFERFVECLVAHARVRGLSDETATYWVCALANNQHNLGVDMAPDGELAATAFARALARAGGLVAVVDPGGEQLRRSWCVFEMYTAAVSDAAKLFDAVAVVRVDGSERAVVVTQGIAAADETGNWTQNKVRREAAFPLPLMERALVFDVRNAEASEPVDKVRIDEAIGGKEEVVNATVAVQLNAPRLARVIYGADAATRAELLGKLASSSARTLALIVDQADTAVDELVGLSLPATLADLRMVGTSSRVLRGVIARSLSLTHLSARGMRDADRAEQLSATLLRLRQLVFLSLGDSLLGDAGCASLAGALGQLTSLQTLNLYSNQTAMRAVHGWRTLSPNSPFCNSWTSTSTGLAMRAVRRWRAPSDSSHRCRGSGSSAIRSAMRAARRLPARSGGSPRCSNSAWDSTRSVMRAADRLPARLRILPRSRNSASAPTGSAMRAARGWPARLASSQGCRFSASTATGSATRAAHRSQTRSGSSARCSSSTSTPTRFAMRAALHWQARLGYSPR